MLRLVVLIVYLAGMGLLLSYLSRRPPKFSADYVEPEIRPVWVLLWWMTPLLLPLAVTLWWGIIPVSLKSVLATLALSVFVPIILYGLFFAWTGVFKNWVALGYVFISALLSLWAAGILLVESTPLLTLFMLIGSLALPPMLFLTWVIIWAPAFLPLEAEVLNAELQKVLAHFTAFFTTYSKTTWVITGGEIKTRISGNPFLGSGPGLVITEPENAVAVKGPAAIRGFVGPGAGFTEANETLEAVIDLRQQLRGAKVNAITRDGIEVQMPIASIFRVDGSQSPELGKPWPYHKSAAYKALFAAEVNPEGKTPLDAHHSHPWEELPLKVAIHQLKQVVAARALDELYGMLETDMETLPRLAVGKTVRAAVTAELEPKGFKIQGGGVGNQIVPLDPNVTRQRIENWKAIWINKVMQNTAASAQERVVQFQRVQGRVQEELYAGLLTQSQKMREGGAEVSQTMVMVQLLEALEHIAREPNVMPLLPESAQPTLNMLLHFNDEYAGKEARRG